MAIVYTDCCDGYIDMDFSSDSLVIVRHTKEDYYYENYMHWECAVEAGYLTEEQAAEGVSFIEVREE